MDDHITALRAIVTDNSPHNVYMLQDWAMRYSMKKPYELKVKQYVNSLKLINSMELPELPPFKGKDQCLTEDTIKQIVVHGVPQHWHQKMTESDFRPMEKSLTELVKFMESQEEADLEGGRNRGNNGSNKRQKTNRNGGHGNGRSSSTTGMWCDHHHVDSHNTEDCRSKPFHKNNNGSNKNNNKSQYRGKSNGKPWAKKAEAEKTYTKAEVNALIQKGFKQLKSSLAKNNKRKTSDDGSVNFVDLMWMDIDTTDNTTTNADTKRKATEIKNSAAGARASSGNPKIEILEIVDSDAADATNTIYGSEIVKKWVNGKKIEKPEKSKVTKSGEPDAGVQGVGSDLVNESRTTLKIKKNKKIKKIKGVTKAMEHLEIKDPDADSGVNPNDKKIESMSEAELKPSELDLDEIDAQLMDYRDGTDKLNIDT